MHIDIDEQAEDHLPQLVERTVAGEEIILDSNGKPVAKLDVLEEKTRNHAAVGSGKEK